MAGSGLQPQSEREDGWQALMGGTHLVILNIRRRRRARRTLIPKEVPGLNIAQTTSKMLPTVT